MAPAREARVIELALTGALQITDPSGEQIRDIPVTPGETITFRVDNTAGFDHSFYIGTDEELIVPDAMTDVGIPTWQSGVQELTWVVPADITGLKFGCTVPGHYALEQGAFSVTGGTLAAGGQPPGSGMFGLAASLAEARWDHTATLLPDGRVLVIGGLGDDGTLDSSEAWEFRDRHLRPGRFARGGPLAPYHYAPARWPRPRRRRSRPLRPKWHALGVAGRQRHPQLGGGLGPGNQHVRPGGLADGGPRAAHRHAPAQRHRPRHGRSGYHGNVLPTAVWAPEVKTFSQGGSLAEARSSHTATLLPDGRVLVIGGFHGGNNVLASAEVWDPVRRSFTAAGSPAEARGDHTATSCPMAASSSSSSGARMAAALHSAELCVPATGTFGPAGSLAEARRSHSATLLPDGRVLVVGGWDGSRVLDWRSSGIRRPARSARLARSNLAATSTQARSCPTAASSSSAARMVATTFSASQRSSPLTPLTSADPATAVTAFLDALVAKQWDTLPLLACAAERDSVASFFGIGDATTGPLLDMMRISVMSGTSVTPTETSGSTATVTIDGQLSWQVPDEAWRAFFTQVYADADPSPAPSEIDQFVAEAQASFQALTLAPEVTVVNESGGWLLCSDIVSSATATPSPTASPVPSPTASPMPSPTASPTPSPTASPTPSPPPQPDAVPHREPDAVPHREPDAHTSCDRGRARGCLRRERRSRGRQIRGQGPPARRGRLVANHRCRLVWHQHQVGG